MKKIFAITFLLIAMPVYAQTVQGTANTWFSPSSGATNAGLTSQSTGVPASVSGYTPLEPLSAFNGGKYANFADYLATIYKLLITVGALVAVVMLVTGGVRYMLSESFTDKSSAKNRIINALWGLTILIGSFLILYTINPSLLTFNLLLPTVNQQAAQYGVATGGTNPTTAQQLNDAAPGTSVGTMTADQKQKIGNLEGLSGITFAISDRYTLFDSSQLTTAQLNNVINGYKDYCEKTGPLQGLTGGLAHYTTYEVPASVFGGSGQQSALVCIAN